MKAREIAKKIAHDRAFTNPITSEELEPHMDGENVTPKRLEKAQEAFDSLRDQLATKWKLVPAKKKRK